MSSTPLMPDDRRSLTTRLTVLQYLVAVTFAVLAIGFWIFQIAQHEKFREMAEENHLRRLPLPAPRGVLLDRDGKVLVDNQSSFNIALVREQTRDLDATLHILAVATNTDEEQLRETVNRRRREPSYRPIILIENATRAQYMAIMARRWCSIRRPGKCSRSRAGRRSIRTRLPAASIALRGTRSTPTI